uniref:YicC family protein n=1 Tax=Desulfobacca acetoxidans TaxID=60893 RepID=A0A7C3UZ49_9BACT
MIKSMTGYGRGEVEMGGLKWVVELKSVNHRFLEISPNLPRHLWALEDRIRRQIKNRLARGRVDMQLSWEGQAEKSPKLTLDPAMTAEVRGLLTDLAGILPEPEPVRLDHLLQFADLIVARERQAQDVEEIWEAVSQALAQALDFLEDMRGNEGAALAEEIQGHLARVGLELQRIRSQADLVPGLWQERLRVRLEELLAESTPVDEGRLAQEVALLAERRDIREELTRLESHLAQFREALARPGPVGRNLEFLLQEMFRETNTIGVKAGDLDIAQAVVTIKGLLERLREQVQNLE